MKRCVSLMKNKKRLCVAFAFCLLFVGFLFRSETGWTVAAEAKMSQSKATMLAGKKLQLSVDNADSAKISKQTWSSTKKTVATVTKTGLVTAKKQGTATIKCVLTYTDGKKNELSCEVTVVNKASISLDFLETMADYVAEKFRLADISALISDAFSRIYLLENKNGADGEDGSYRWEYVFTEIYPGAQFRSDTKVIRTIDESATCVYYELDGSEQKLRITCHDGWASIYNAFIFLDASDNIILKSNYVKGTRYNRMVMSVPEGAVKLYVNGERQYGAHIEVARTDEVTDIGNLSYLLSEFGKKLQYRDDFAWKPFPTGIFAFTFDDSLTDIWQVVDDFSAHHAVAGFGCEAYMLPSAVPYTDSNGKKQFKTVADVMLEAQEKGFEVYAHGSSDDVYGDKVTPEKMTDVNFMFRKFVENKSKFAAYGLKVRGIMTTGGSNRISNVDGTDQWVRLFYDYGDEYGLEEPYFHQRKFVDTGNMTSVKAMIDKAIKNKEFIHFGFHQYASSRESILKMVDYIQSKGGRIMVLGDIYDTYGSTEEIVDILLRLEKLEKK